MPNIVGQRYSACIKSGFGSRDRLCRKSVTIFENQILSGQNNHSTFNKQIEAHRWSVIQSPVLEASLHACTFEFLASASGRCCSTILLGQQFLVRTKRAVELAVQRVSLIYTFQGAKPLEGLPIQSSRFCRLALTTS